MARAMPTGGHDSPTRYRPNAVDYRNMSPEHVEEYVSVCRAIEEIEELLELKPGQPLRFHVKIRSALRTAEGYLRRSAWMLIAYYGRELDGSSSDTGGSGSGARRIKGAGPAVDGARRDADSISS